MVSVRSQFDSMLEVGQRNAKDGYVSQAELDSEALIAEKYQGIRPATRLARTTVSRRICLRCCSARKSARSATTSYRTWRSGAT